jgi:hypothetical protein
MVISSDDWWDGPSRIQGDIRANRAPPADLKRPCKMISARMGEAENRGQSGGLCYEHGLSLNDLLPSLASSGRRDDLAT